MSRCFTGRDLNSTANVINGDKVVTINRKYIFKSFSTALIEIKKNVFQTIIGDVIKI